MTGNDTVDVSRLRILPIALDQQPKNTNALIYGLRLKIKSPEFSLDFSPDFSQSLSLISQSLIIVLWFFLQVMDDQKREDVVL